MLLTLKNIFRDAVITYFECNEHIQEWPVSFAYRPFLYILYFLTDSLVLLQILHSLQTCLTHFKLLLNIMHITFKFLIRIDQVFYGLAGINYRGMVSPSKKGTNRLQ